MKPAASALFTLLMLLGACRPDPRQQAEPLDLLPASATALIQIRDAERFRSEYRNNTLLQNYRKSGSENRIFKALDQVLDLELTGESLLALRAGGDPDPAWVLLFEGTGTRPGDSLPAMGSIPAWTLPDSLGLITRTRGAIHMVANSRAYLEEGLESGTGEKEGLRQALATANPAASASLLLPSGHRHALREFLLGPEAIAGPVNGPSWSAYDLGLRSDALMVQGVEVRPDSLWDQRILLRGIPVMPLEEIGRIAPPDATALYGISMQQPGEFLRNQQQLLGRSDSTPGILEGVEQLGFIRTGGEDLLVLICASPQGVVDALRPSLEELEPFQEARIYGLQDAGSLRATFEPLLNRLQPPSFLGQIGNYLVLGPTLEGIRNAVSAFTREDSFDTGPRMSGLRPYLSSESSALLIATDPRDAASLTDSLSALSLPDGIAVHLPDAYLFTGQLTRSEGYDLLEYQFRKKDDPSGTGASVSTIFTRKLDGLLQAGPYMLKNHRTGGMDVAVQDDRNQLYLFSARGELYWKKELPGPIQGEIHQVDLFRNGRFQMAFTTPDQLLVLDRDGKPVAPFPKTFTGGNLGPLALFDYDGNRNYRLVVAQGPKIFMLDGQGRDVTGFKFRDAGSPVLGEAQHIRVGSRDFLLFRLEDGRLRILNRVGDTRVKTDGTFDFSGNGVFLYRDKFTFTEKSGGLVTIDTRGRVSRTNLNLNPDHGMYATANTLALMNDNLFQVKGNRAELDLGVYSRPRIFYLYDIIYVAVTDIQSQRLYLFRSDASAVPGFPVEGSGLPDMADMDGDRNPELAVKFRDSSLAVYRLQR